LHFGRLAFNDADGQAVQEQHDVRHNVVFRAGDANFELGDGNERVVGSILKVHVTDGGTDLASLVIDRHRSVLEQIPEHLLVVLDEVAAGKRSEATGNFRNLIVTQER